MKRLFDVTVVVISLILLSPFILVLAFILLVVDGRPVIFKQSRVGKDGQEFILYKFRTMRVSEGTEKGSFDIGSTSRVTPLGALLRKTKLDELPQLMNVIRGEMSLVGPRPEVRKWVEVYPDLWAIVHKVRPGITDPASIIYRDEESLLSQSSEPEVTYRDVILPHKLNLYIKYIDSQSLAGDIRLLFCTIWKII